MAENRCLYCYEPIGDASGDYHPRCSKLFYGSEIPPVLEYSLADMEQLAKEIVIKSVAVTGVQPKLSLDIERKQGDPKYSRLTLVGLWGQFILKPPTKEFPHLPENEDLTMHLANITRIGVAEHSLIRLQSGELAYVTKRFDRKDGRKIPVEDMCQLTETLTEHKYRSSMEKVGKHMIRYSTVPGFDAFRLFQLTVFSYLTGNSDMHLKNFSLVTNDEGFTLMSPAYDLLNTKLAMPADSEEIALTLNGKKAKLERKDFDAFGTSLKLGDKAIRNAYATITDNLPAMFELVKKSFLPKVSAAAYEHLMRERLTKIELS